MSVMLAISSIQPSAVIIWMVVRIQTGKLMEMKKKAAKPDQEDHTPELEDAQPPIGEECTFGSACHDGSPGLVSQLTGIASARCPNMCYPHVMPGACLVVGTRIVAASAGRYNTLLLDEMGALYTFG